jgi:hypothetical protein
MSRTLTTGESMPVANKKKKLKKAENIIIAITYGSKTGKLKKKHLNRKRMANQ